MRTGLFPSISSLPAGRSRSGAYVLVFMLLLVSYPTLRGSSWVGSTELHTLIGAVATLVSQIGFDPVEPARFFCTPIIHSTGPDAPLRICFGIVETITGLIRFWIEQQHPLA